MSDPVQHRHDAVRQAIDILARDHAERRLAGEASEADAYFTDLRRLIETRSLSLALVAEDGPMGGGGSGEA